MTSDMATDPNGQPIEGEILNPNEALAAHPKKILRGDGPPSSFDQEKAELILKFLTHGCYIETAAAAAGVSKTTLWHWLKRASRDKTPELVQFEQDVERAMAGAELLSLQNISRAAESGIWQASAWLLERRHPERYGRRYTLDVNVDLRQRAERLAPKLGIPVEELYERAKAVLEKMED